MKHWVFTLTLIFSLFAWPAMAQEDDLDVTLSVVEDEGEAEEQLVNDIELPADADEQAQENAAFGLDTANQARQQGREFGEERAEQGQENREDGTLDNNPIQ